MMYALIIIFILTLIALVFISSSGLFRDESAPAGEPLDISRWEKVDKSTALEGGFTLTGEAINYGNGRSYKLHMKTGDNGRQVWYAEFVDRDEWYKTDIGEDQ